MAEGTQQAATLYPGFRPPSEVLWVNSADPDTASKYALKPPSITLSDVAVGMTVRAVTEPLVKAAQRTWMAAAPKIAVLLLVDCKCSRSSCNLTEAGPLPASFFGMAVAATVKCYCGPRVWKYINTDKTQALWDELFKLTARKYYLKIDTDTMLEPSPLLRHINVLHEETRSKLPYPSMLYFGRDDTAWGASYPKLISTTWYKDFTQRISRELDELDELPPAFGPLSRSKSLLVPYAQGGLIGLSHKMLRLIVQTRCVQRIGHVVRPSEYGVKSHIDSEDAALGVCMHIFGAPLVSTVCIHEHTSCACDVENATQRRLNCQEDKWDVNSCRVGAISMHRLKKVARYDQCWSWQQEALSAQRETFLRPFT
uniref:Hexosyltransferase n=1 Tax=Chrysotila carterae TaxID=13221 RepID=A0A7S4B1K7_CHRCT|mmetsp:Transcript_32981/g.72470  ORF Transcript_32981/g.72470 Transcript_32981/m.72470 type:complete len:369 (+) Transcript_32981:21-1127(+)|eukprot:643361-Pleurochrysis_carterae.AAC.2